jgi:hypothetical protein
MIRPALIDPDRIRCVPVCPDTISPCRIRAGQVSPDTIERPPPAGHT